MSTIKIVIKEAFDVVEELVPKAARAVAEKSAKLGSKARQIKQQIDSTDVELAGSQRTPDRAPDHDALEPTTPSADPLRQPDAPPAARDVPDTWPDVDTEAANAATAAARRAEHEANGGEPNWRDLTERFHGERPGDMPNPHGHHIVFKKGRPGPMQDALDESKAILERNGIDWYTGPHNLIWAPNRGHSLANAEAVRDLLAEADGKGRQAVIDALRHAGRSIFDGRP